MKDSTNYYYKDMPTPNLGIDVFLRDYEQKGQHFKLHWHEYMQIYFFVKGTAWVECNKKRYDVQPNSIIIINPNELHYLENLSHHLKFYTIRIDIAFLFSNHPDLCQTKYLAPLLHNQILFQNQIENDEKILDCITTIIDEYFSQEIGYELAMKSSIYNLIVYLLRNDIKKFITERELSTKINTLNRFKLIFSYIEAHCSEKICTEQLANIIHINYHSFRCAQGTKIYEKCLSP